MSNASNKNDEEVFKEGCKRVKTGDLEIVGGSLIFQGQKVPISDGHNLDLGEAKVIFENIKNEDYELVGGLFISKEQKAGLLVFLGGFCCIFCQNYHYAIDYYLQGLQILQELGDKKLECTVCSQMADAFSRLGRYDQSSKYSKQAVDIALRLNEPQLLAECYVSQGNSFLSIFDFENAAACYSRAREYFKKLEQPEDEKSLAMCSANLSMAYLIQGKFDVGIDLLEESLRIGEKLLNKEMQASSLSNLANVHFLMNNFEKATELYCQSLVLAKEINNVFIKQVCYGNLGNLFARAQDYKRAIVMFFGLLEIAKRFGYKESQAQAYMNIGACYRHMKQYDKATLYFGIAFHIVKEIKSTYLESMLHFNMAVLQSDKGEFEEALSMWKEAMRNFPADGDKLQKNGLYLLSACVHLQQAKGKTDREEREQCRLKAEEYLKKAIDCHDFAFSHLSQHNPFKVTAFDSFSYIYLLLAEVLLKRGQLEEALLVSDRGKARALGDCMSLLYGISQDKSLASKPLTYPDVESVCSSDSFTLLHYRILDESLVIWILSKDSMMVKEIGKEQIFPAFETFSGETTTKEDDLVYCIFEDIVKRAYDNMMTKEQDKACENRSLDDCIIPQCSIVTVSLARDEKRGKKTGQDSVQGAFEDIVAKAFADMGITEDVNFENKSLNDCFASPNQHCASGNHSLPGDESNAKKISPTEDDTVQHALDEIVAKAFEDMGITEDVNCENRSLDDCLISPNQHCASGTDSLLRDESRGTITRLKKEDNVVQRAFEHILAKAFEDMAITEDVNCENRSLDDCFTTQDQHCASGTDSLPRDGISVKTTGQDSDQGAFEDIVEDMKLIEDVACENRSLDDCVPADDSLSRDGRRGKKAAPDLHPLVAALVVLHKTLIAPVLPHVQHDEIVIVPDGPLYSVPFAALVDPKTGTFLSQRKRIRLAPSITVLKLLQECQVDHHSQKGALIVGNPVTGEVSFRGKKRTFSDLPSAGIEASCVSSLLKQGNTTITTLTEKQATKDAVLAKIKEGVAVIHIAAHGNSDTGEIVLAPNPSRDRQCLPEEPDYLLTMKEVQEAGVKAQLVVLSCCHSGGGEIRGEGMIGLSRTFLAAGARAVVASICAIKDQATLSFMVSFYDRLCRGDSASVSLNKAMKEIRSEPNHSNPIYWAPFFLLGDDVTINFDE